MVQINVRNCPSCDGAHELVECHEYNATSASHGGTKLWSHWFTCPTTGDPVSVLIQIDDGKVYEVEPEIIGSIMQARKAGKYVVAVFRQEPAGNGMWITHCTQHPHDFLTDHFGTCVNLLKDAFDKVVGPPTKEVPMLRAKPEPAVQLWQPQKMAPMQPVEQILDDDDDDAGRDKD